MAISFDQLKGKKLGICVSGGLDSKTVTKRFLEAGLDVICFSADLGQPDQPDDKAQDHAPKGDLIEQDQRIFQRGLRSRAFHL